MWQWLQGLSGGAATFLGALTGSSIGLIAIVVGALFNAHLNRRSDDRKRRDEVRAVATALQAELMGIHRSLVRNADELRKKEREADFLVPDFALSVSVFPEMLSKLGLLDVETIRSVIDAYIIVRQYGDHLILRGGMRGSKERDQDRLIAVPDEKRKTVISLNEVTAAEIDKAIKKLAQYT